LAGLDNALRGANRVTSVWLGFTTAGPMALADAACADVAMSINPARNVTEADARREGDERTG
jgi:hypothetical protein